MKNLLAALDRLRTEQQTLGRSLLSGRLDPVKECQPLLISLDGLRKAAIRAPVRKPALDSAEVWRVFQAENYQLSALDSLQIRSLCTTQTTALNPRFVDALATNPEVLRRSLCLYGVVNAYFSAWRTMDFPEKLEFVIQSAVEKQTETNPVIQVWRRSPVLFSENAANYLAQSIVRSRSNIRQALERFFVGAGTTLALHVRAAVAAQAVDHFQRQESVGSEESNLGYLDWMIREVLPPPLLNDPYESAVGNLILSKSAQKSAGFQERLRDYVRGDKRLGDPRLAVNRPHWTSMAPPAQRRFLSWLARDSIIFFFNTILPDTNLNRLRKDFWLQYANQIRDFQVAVSEQDSWKLKSINSEMLRGCARSGSCHNQCVLNAI